MLPPENSKRNHPEAVKSGDGLATALFYLALGLLVAGGTLGVISRSLRYAAVRNTEQVRSGALQFFRKEIPALNESRRTGRPVVVFILPVQPKPLDPAGEQMLQCCVLYLLLSEDEEFLAVPGRPEYAGATAGLPYYAALDSQGKLIRADSSLAVVLESVQAPLQPGAERQ